MPSLKTVSIRKMRTSNDVPAQLVIMNGKIQTIDGQIPDIDLPDGTYVNLITRRDAQALVREKILRKTQQEVLAEIVAEPTKGMSLGQAKAKPIKQKRAKFSKR
jgi:hypothetical protein